MGFLWHTHEYNQLIGWRVEGGGFLMVSHWLSWNRNKIFLLVTTQRPQRSALHIIKTFTLLLYILYIVNRL